MKKLMKKLTSTVLIAVLFVSCIPISARASVSSEQVSTPQLINYYHSAEYGSTMRNIEYYDITTQGFQLTVSGRTQKPYEQYRVTVRTADIAKYLFPTVSLGKQNGSNYFSKTLDFSTLEVGDYYVSVRFNDTGDGTFPKEAQMRYIPVQRTSYGVYIKKYTAVEDENAAIRRSNTYQPMYYMDTSMADMPFELRDGRYYSSNDVSELTEAQQRTIKELAESIVGSETDDYKKLLLIHDYLAENLYYDLPYNKADQDLKRWMSENGLITLNPYTLACKLKNGKKTSSVCSGISALYAAMARSLGIPCRTARGRSLKIPENAWELLTDEGLVTVTHVWNEAYVNGEWIFIDVTRDCSNDFDGTQYIKNSGEIVRYSGFDPSPQAIAVAILYKNYRETVYAALDSPTVDAIENRYEPLTITWTPVEGATGYVVYRSCGLGYYDTIATTTDTSYTDTGLSPGTKYYYRVAAVDLNGIETRRSKYKSVNVTAINQVEMVGSSGEEGQSMIQFKGQAGVTTYKIYRSTSLNGAYSLIDTINSSDEIITYEDYDDLSYGKTYYYKVRGIKGADTLAPLSEPMSCQVGVPTPTLSLISGRNRYVRLWWEGMEQVKTYHIYRASSATGEYEEIATVDGSQSLYKSGLLTVGKKYYYKITAEAANGVVSELSNCKAVTVKPVDTPVLKSVSVSKRVVTLRWEPTRDAVKYYVYRSKTKDGTYTKVATVTGKNCVYKSGKLTVGTKYYWKAKAVTANGAVSDYSLHKAITVR